MSLFQSLLRIKILRHPNSAGIPRHPNSASLAAIRVPPPAKRRLSGGVWQPFATRQTVGVRQPTPRHPPTVGKRWVSGNKRWVSGNQRWVSGNQRWVSGNQRWVSGNQRWVSGNQRWVSGNLATPWVSGNPLLSAQDICKMACPATIVVDGTDARRRIRCK
jgi:hypothetical protein